MDRAADKRERLLGIALAFLALTIAGSLALKAGEARAAEEITLFSTSVSSTQAGGHPDVDYTVGWTDRTGTDSPCNCEDARVLDMHFPTGFIGNPHVVPTCTLAQFSLQTCAPETQVGVIEALTILRQAIFNLTPHPDEPGLVGFYVPIVNSVVFVKLHARTGSDYGLDTTSSPLYHVLPVNTITVHLWGVPADPVHDASRFPVKKPGGVQCPPYPQGCYGPVASTATPAPYLQNPTTCGVPLTASHTIEYYSGTHVVAEYPWPATTGCDQLTFNSSLKITPTTTAADSASGLDLELKVPQSQSVSSPSPSEIRQVSTTLPSGFSLSASAANGKVACADDELSFSTEDAAHCPEFAKIGTSTIDSSALPGPIDGDIYIGQPLPEQRYRIFVTADGFATHVKLKGAVQVDPQTGQITTTFSELPQSPIQQVDLHFFGSERGIFATPGKCGTFPVVTRFVPWDEALEDQTSTNEIVIDRGANGTPCPGVSNPFQPKVGAGTTDNTAGTYSPFTVQVERIDGNQVPTAINVKTPPGFLASLRGVTYCPEAIISALKNGAYSGRQEQSLPACPASSRVGSVKAGAGAGTRPLFVDGQVYLAGPYRGGPVSLVVVVPAVSGPYDLGNVVVRAAVRLDAKSAQVTTVSDSLPRILDGVPLRTRYLQIRLDRPNFTLNPTNCDPFSVLIGLFGDEGGSVEAPKYFQVANCAGMDFGPSLKLKLSGGLEARGHPAIHADLLALPGESNARGVSVTLPYGELLDNAHIGTVCRRPEFVTDTCPSRSLLGHAEVTTPLLDQPLKGPIYLRASTNKLPDIAMDLEGQVDLELAGRVDAVKGRLRTTFESLPDAPVTSVSLDLLGGARGLLVNSEGFCRKVKRSLVVMTGQNGNVVKRRPRIQAACGAAERRKRGNRQGRR